MSAAASSIAGGSARILAARAVASVAAFATVLTLARGLPPAGRGAVAFVWMTALVLAGVSRLGLDSAATVLVARRVDERSRILTNLLLFSLAAAAAAGGLAALVLGLSPSLRPAGIEGVELVALALGTVGLALQGAAVAFLIGCERFRDQAIASASAAVLLAGLVVGYELAGALSVRVALLLWAGAQLAGAAVGLATAMAAARPGRPSGALFRESLAFGVRAWAGSVAAFLNARVDQVIMGLISTEAALGFYAVAVNASEVVLYLPASVAMVLVPSISRAAAEERAETTLRMFRSLVLLTAGLVLAGLASAPLIPLVFGSAYSPAVEPYLILLPGGLAFVALVVFSGSLVASSAPGRSSLGPLAALVVGVGLDLALIPALGANGAAVAATAAFAVGGAVAILVYRATVGIAARALLPGKSDVELIQGLVRRFARPSRAST